MLVEIARHIQLNEMLELGGGGEVSMMNDSIVCKFVFILFASLINHYMCELTEVHG